MDNKKEAPRKSVLSILLDFSPILGALIGLAVGACFVALWGVGPGKFFSELFRGAFGDRLALGSTLNRSTPLLIIGSGTAIAFRAGANNIGQEGQLFVGGLGAAVVALLLPNLPGALGIPMIFLLSMALGMAFAGIAVIFRLLKGVNELLTTLLLNYIGQLLVSAMVNGPFVSSTNVSFPQTDPFGPQFLITNWPRMGYLHAGIFMALFVLALSAYFLWRTPTGLRLRTAGLSPLAAKTSGCNPTKLFILGMLLSGALCGLAGSIEVIGTNDSLRQNFGSGLGFDALAVALLGNTNPIGVLPAGLFFGALRSGMQAMQRSIGIPSVLLDLIKGCIMIFIMVGAALKAHVKTTVRISKSAKQDTGAPAAAVEGGS